MKKIKKLFSLMLLFVLVFSIGAYAEDNNNFFTENESYIKMFADMELDHNIYHVGKNSNQRPFNTTKRGSLALSKEKIELLSAYLKELDSVMVNSHSDNYTKALSNYSYRGGLKLDFKKIENTTVTIELKYYNEYVSIDIDISDRNGKIFEDGIKYFATGSKKVTDKEKFFEILKKITVDIYGASPEIRESTPELISVESKNWDWENKTLEDARAPDVFTKVSFEHIKKIEFDITVDERFEDSFLAFVKNKEETVHCSLDVYGFSSISYRILTLTGDKGTIQLFNNHNNIGMYNGGYTTLTFSMSHVFENNTAFVQSHACHDQLIIEGKSSDGKTIDTITAHTEFEGTRNEIYIEVSNIKYQSLNNDKAPNVIRVGEYWGLESQRTYAEHKPTENENFTPTTNMLDFAENGKIREFIYKYEENGEIKTLSRRPSQLSAEIISEIKTVLKDLNLEKSDIKTTAGNQGYTLMIDFENTNKSDDVTEFKLFDNYVSINRDYYSHLQCYEYGDSGLREKLISIAERLKNLNEEEKQEVSKEFVTTDLRESSAERRWTVDVDYVATADIDIPTSIEWYTDLGNNVSVSIVSMVRILNETDIYHEPMIKFSGDKGTKWFKLSMIEYHRPTGESTKLTDDKTVYAAFSGLESFKNFVTVRKESGYEKIEMYLNFTDETKSSLESIRFIADGSEKSIPIENFNYIGGEKSYEKWYK